MEKQIVIYSYCRIWCSNTKNKLSTHITTWVKLEYLIKKKTPDTKLCPSCMFKDSQNYASGKWGINWEKWYEWTFLDDWNVLPQPWWWLHDVHPQSCTNKIYLSLCKLHLSIFKRLNVIIKSQNQPDKWMMFNKL